MIIDFSTTEDKIKICFNNDVNLLTFPKHKIIFILWNSYQSQSLILEPSDNIQIFKKEYEKYKCEYQNQIIFCYHLEGFESKLAKIVSFLPSNFLKFCNLNIFWYQIIIKDKIYEENFSFDLSKNYQVEIDIFNLKEDSFLDFNLSEEIKLFNSLNLNNERWEKEIKELTLDNILLEKKNLNHKYEEFHRFLDNNLKKNKYLGELIDEYISNLERKLNKKNIKSIKNIKTKHDKLDFKKQLIDKIHVEVKKGNKNSEGEIDYLESEVLKKKKYLANLNQEIKTLEQKKNKKIKLTEQINGRPDVNILENQSVKYKKPKILKFEKKNIDTNLYLNPDVKPSHHINKPIRKETTQNKLNLVNNEIQVNKEIQVHKDSQVNKEIQVNKDSQVNNPKIINLAVMIHMYKFSLWEEFTEYLDRLNSCQVYFDLYINIAIDPKTNQDKIPAMVNKIKSYSMYENIYFSFSDNRGLDIGGFMMSYLKMLELGKKYFSIIKIHTKTNKNWRFIMLYSLLGNKKIIKNNLNLINSPHVGMIGYQIAGLNFNTTKIVKNYIFEYVDRFKQKNIAGHFIPGTIFWIKGEVLHKYFTFELLTTCYQEFKPYYCGSAINRTEGKPHAFERFFGILVENCKLKTIKFDSTV